MDKSMDKPSGICTAQRAYPVLSETHVETGGAYS